MSYLIQTEDIAAGCPGALSPLNITFSPDGKLLTYIYYDSQFKRQIFSVSVGPGSTYVPKKLVDVSNYSQNLSHEEKLRRERMRVLADGIISFEWGQKVGEKGEMRMLIPVAGRIFIFDWINDEEHSLTEVYDGQKGSAIDPHLSPDCLSVAFVLKDDLYMINLQAQYGSEVQATHSLTRLTYEGAEEGISCGVADYIAQEEMDRYRGFWWSPNSQQIVFTVNDEREVYKHTIIKQEGIKQSIETHRYPFAGQKNALVRVACLTVSDYLPPLSSISPSTPPAYQFFSLIDEKDPRFTIAGQVEHYVCRVGWYRAGQVMVQVENREQSLLQLIKIDTSTGEREVLVEEETTVWINLHNLFHVFSPSSLSEGDFYFLWGSERGGFRHLYLYLYKKEEGKAEVVGEGPVDSDAEGVVSSIDGVDVERGVVYFTSNLGNCLETHLFSAPLFPSPSTSAPTPSRLSLSPGTHSTSLSPTFSHVSLLTHCLTAPYSLSLYSLSSPSTQTPKSLDFLSLLEDAQERDPRILNNPALFSSLSPPTLFTIKGGEGEGGEKGVDLHCAVYLPSGITLGEEEKKGEKAPLLPLIVSVYGGPHVQRVSLSWLLTGDLTSQRYAQRGCVVLKCDNRGAANRGLGFEGQLKGRLGKVELDDQERAVGYLVERGLVDRERVGIVGWSYGGYLAARGVMERGGAGGVFCCGVAGAPVTNWEVYDTHYTERYIGLPQRSPLSYSQSSLLPLAPLLSSPLLLIHGLVDENVHFTHSSLLIEELTCQQREYELIVLPGERHGPQKRESRRYVEEKTWMFFDKHLGEKKRARESVEEESDGRSVETEEERSEERGMVRGGGGSRVSLTSHI